MSNMRSKHKHKAKAPQRKGNNLRRFIDRSKIWKWHAEIIQLETGGK
jgi:hypothetical protein